LFDENRAKVNVATKNLIFKAKIMPLMIQITVFLEILISCFLRLEGLWLSRWASQLSRTPRNRNLPAWRMEGVFRLARGMPIVSSTGLKGERSRPRAKVAANNLGLDEEML
jgi:hypothetical protein